MTNQNLATVELTKDELEVLSIALELRRIQRRRDSLGIPRPLDSDSVEAKVDDALRELA